MAETPRYVRPTIGGWLRPLLLAPFAAACLSAMAYAFGFQHGLIGPWVSLAIGLAAASL